MIITVIVMVLTLPPQRFEGAYVAVQGQKRRVFPCAVVEAAGAVVRGDGCDMDVAHPPLLFLPTFRRPFGAPGRCPHRAFRPWFCE